MTQFAVTWLEFCEFCAFLIGLRPLACASRPSGSCARLIWYVRASNCGRAWGLRPARGIACIMRGDMRRAARIKPKGQNSLLQWKKLNFIQNQEKFSRRPKKKAKATFFLAFHVSCVGTHGLPKNRKSSSLLWILFLAFAENWFFWALLRKKLNTWFFGLDRIWTYNSPAGK